jgi:four helix bundle protein
MEDGEMEDGKGHRMTPGLLLARLEKFALDVLGTTRPLCRAVETTDMARQLRRAGTGAYMNHGAASVARSHADFTSKLGVAFEEADESTRWLALLRKAGYLSGSPTEVLLNEAGELRAILSAAHLTAKRNRKKDD